jgi:hypothetical protein
MKNNIYILLLFFSFNLWSIENIIDVIDRDPCVIKQCLISMETPFDISYVKYSSWKHFPGVHFQVNHDLKSVCWLQVVRTDSKDIKLQEFVDACDELFPIYKHGANFYDIPIWNYGFFSKPLSFWRAHSYAVVLDHNQKTIQCLGGISWGFELSFWRLWPCMILPKSLDELDWIQDWNVFKKALPEYTITQ